MSDNGIGGVFKYRNGEVVTRLRDEEDLTAEQAAVVALMDVAKQLDGIRGALKSIADLIARK